MATGKGFSLSLEGLEVIISELDAFIEDIDERLDKALTKIALKIIQDAKRLAPIDTGDLEAALIVDDVKKTVESMYIDFGASVDVNDYAVVQHEGFMHRNGKLVPLTPGEKTRSKGMYNGYMPGKKFLENAIKMNEAWILEELANALKVG